MINNLTNKIWKILKYLSIIYNRKLINKKLTNGGLMVNFIDKTFILLADILLQVLPLDMKSKRAFLYYRGGLRAQARGNYSEALENYYHSLRLEEIR